MPSTLPSSGFQNPAYLPTAAWICYYDPSGPFSVLKTGVTVHIKLVLGKRRQALALGDPFLPFNVQGGT